MDTPTTTPTLAVIELVVTEMPRALAFYRRLGLDLPAELDAEPHAEVALPGGLRLAWDTTEVIHSFDPGWTRPSGGHRQALAFDCGSPAEVDATYARLIGEGSGEGTSHLEPWDAFWGMRYAVVHDPDENAVDLFAWLPGQGPSASEG